MNNFNVDLFWSKVEKTKDCWEWVGCKTDGGYGRYGRKIKLQKAHRISWTLINGEIPKGLFVLHKCDNPSCVKPEHLFLGTAKDNTQDMISKGRKSDVSGEKHPNSYP